MGIFVVTRARRPWTQSALWNYSARHPGHLGIEPSTVPVSIARTTYMTTMHDTKERSRRGAERIAKEYQLSCEYLRRKCTCPNHQTSSLQKCTIGLSQLLVIVRLECQPALLWRANLLVRVLRLLFRNQSPLVSAALLGSINEQLCLTGESC